MIKMRKYTRLFALCIVLGIGVYLHHNWVLKKFYQRHMEALAGDLSTSCTIPRYDPFDPSILKYVVQPWPKIDCTSSQLPLTFIDGEGRLRINATAAGQYKGTVQCSVQQVFRRTDDDDNIDLGPPIMVTGEDILEYEFSVVHCVELPMKRGIYETGYARIVPVAQELSEKSQKAAKDGRLNVVVLVFESMSRLNFIRQLPKTHAFINEKLGGVVMEGLTKVGDNTYSNMVPFLSGLAAGYSVMSPKFGDGNTPAGFSDHLPAVWKNFSSHGHVTLYAEDDAEITTFNYMAKGFKRPPTDYYMRPFWLAMDKQKRWAWDSRCYGHIAKYAFLFNYMEEFITKMQAEKRAFFSFTFLSHLSHDAINPIQVIDLELETYLKRLHTNGAFKNTMLLIMGDHGNRFDPIRNTVIGRIEERMPYLSVILPKALEHFRDNLKANAEVLTSWMDVYETVMDVAMLNTELKSKQKRYGPLGLSLFRPIPSDRTCSEIGIPNVYCVCWNEKQMSVNEAKAKSMGFLLVEHTNQFVRQKDKSSQCAVLELDKVVGVQKLLPAQGVAHYKDFAVHFRVTVRVKPSGGLLEGTLKEDAWTEAKVVGDVNRINRYGNQSSCVTDKLLKLYCFCDLKR